jgi:hypothetical protein
METSNKALPISLSLLALEIAISQIGQSEQPKGSNSGPMVDQYLKAVGLNPGYPWCQAFVNWCFEKAAEQMGKAEPVPNTGGVLKCWDMMSLNHRILQREAVSRPQLVKPGMQFVMNYGHGQGHTGIVERIEGLVLHTIEGNTNEAGSREGCVVARKERRMDDKLMLGFIRYY